MIRVLDDVPAGVLGFEAVDDVKEEDYAKVLVPATHHPASFERMAIVTDARWAGPAVKVFSILWPGQARTFPVAELESAKRWAADRAS